MASPRAHLWGSVFINDLGERTECSLSKYAEDTELCRSVEALQRHLARLAVSCMTLNKAKLGVLPLGHKKTLKAPGLGQGGWKLSGRKESGGDSN